MLRIGNLPLPVGGGMEQLRGRTARVLGVRQHNILLRYILPNSLSPVIVVMTFTVASVILFEAQLSFLGLGVDPSIPTWGSILSDGRLSGTGLVDRLLPRHCHLCHRYGHQPFWGLAAGLSGSPSEDRIGGSDSWNMW